MPILDTSLPMIREAIADVCAAVPDVTVVAREPRTLEGLPAVTIDFDGFVRHDVGIGPDDDQQAESEMGSTDLLTRWIVRLYHGRVGDADDDEDLGRVGLLIATFDINPTLGGIDDPAGIVVASGMISGDRDTVELPNDRELWLVACTVIVKTKHAG